MLALTPFNRNSVAKRNSNELVDFYNIFDDFFSDNFIANRNLKNDSFKIDIKEIGEEYVIEAELPGIKREEIKLDYCEDQLMIGIIREEEKNEEKNNYIHRERKKTSVSRMIYLKDVKIDQIVASLDQGILTIHAPKMIPKENKISIEVK